jgi:hypothetical protein
MAGIHQLFFIGAGEFSSVVVEYFNTSGSPSPNPSAGTIPKSTIQSNGLSLSSVGRYVLTFNGSGAIVSHLFGAGGQNATGGPGPQQGGGGGYTYGTINLSGQNVLTCYIGESNSSPSVGPSPGTYMGGGGAPGGTPDGRWATQGGGFAAIGSGNIPHPLRQDASTNYLMIAGGGGGGTSWISSTRSTVGPNTPSDPADGGGGGGGNNPGHPGIYYYPADGTNSIGRAGTLSSGGAAGYGGRYPGTATAGTKYQGGIGYGGAGGGGYYGGGGADGYYAIGGGGSGYVDPSVTNSGGANGFRGPGGVRDPNTIRPQTPNPSAGNTNTPGLIYITLAP